MIVTNYTLQVQNQRFSAIPPTQIAQIKTYQGASEVAREVNDTYRQFESISKKMIRADRSSNRPGGATDDLNPQKGLVVLGDTSKRLGFPGQAALSYDPETGKIQSLDVRREHEGGATTFLKYDGEKDLLSTQGLNIQMNGNRAFIVELS